MINLQINGGINLDAWLVAITIISITIVVTCIIYLSVKLFKWFKRRCNLVTNNYMRNCYLLSYSFWISSFLSILFIIIIRAIQVNYVVDETILDLTTIDLVKISSIFFVLFQTLFIVFFALFRSKFAESYKKLSLQNLYKISHMKQNKN